MSLTSPAPPRTPGPAAGLALFFGVVAMGLAAAMTLPESVAPFAMPLLALLATAVAIVVFRVDAKQTLLLRLPSVTDLLMAIPLSMSFFILDDQIAGISHARFPVSDETQDYFRQLLTVQTPWDWVEKIGLIGFGAAMSEELMFRGFIQTAFTRRLGRSAAILMTALLFTALHVQYLPVLAAGLLLGFVALATRSIVIPMFVHFTNNVTQILLFNLAGLETLGDPIWIPPTILVPAFVMFALTWGYYMRRIEQDPDLEAAPVPHPEPKLDTISQEPVRLGALHALPSMSSELSSIPTSRRRLGWLVVAVAVLSGTMVLGALYATSIYLMHPQQFHARGIEILEEQITAALEPDALGKQPQIASAFQALALLNETGQLELDDLAHVVRDFRVLKADGGLDANDADAIVISIRDLVMGRTQPRAL